MKKGQKMSEETRAKISASTRGKPKSQQMREKLSVKTKGKKQISQKQREAISEANKRRKGSKMSEAQKEKIKLKAKERWDNPEWAEKRRKQMANSPGPNKGRKFEGKALENIRNTIIRMNNSRKGIKRISLSEEHKHKISLSNMGRVSSMKGKHQSEEAKQKISLKLKGRKRSQEAIEKTASSHRGSKRSEAFKQRMSEIAKNRTYIINYTKETRRIMSEKAKRRYANMTVEERRKYMRPALEAFRKSSPIFSNTSIELILKDKFDKLNVEYIHQYRKWVYSFDFYLPKYNLIVEADGCYWHGCEQCDFQVSDKYKNSQKERDEYVRSKLGMNIIHIMEHEIKNNEFSRLFNLLNDVSV